MINRLFYIDIENVGMKEIEKVKELKETDKVIIFIHEKEEELYKKVCYEFAKVISAVEIETFASREKNALDFQICASIGMLTTKEKNVYIVSRDKGYDSAIEFFGNKGMHVERIESIGSLYKDTILQEQMKEKTKQAIDSDGILKGTTKQIKMCIKIMCNNATKNEFHNALQSTFKDWYTVSRLYKCLLPVYNEYILGGHI